MALALPGQQALQVAAPTNPRAKIEHRFLTKLDEARVEDALIESLANKDITTAALFGAIANDNATFDLSARTS